jgi:uroporphyrinogen decarboxylase
MVRSHSKPLLNVLRGDTVVPAPVWLMRQAGRYLPEYREVRARAGGILDLCFDPALAAEVTLQPIRRYGFDAAILFSDILVVPHALGQRVGFEEGGGPRLDPVRWDGGLRILSSNPVRVVHASLAPVYEAVRLVREALSPETALIGFAGAPWTVAAYMVEGGTSRDFQEVKRWAMASPESIIAL